MHQGKGFRPAPPPPGSAPPVRISYPFLENQLESSFLLMFLWPQEVKVFVMKSMWDGRRPELW